MILSIDPGATGDGPACAYSVDGRITNVRFSFRPPGLNVTAIVVEQWQFRGTQDVPVASRMITMLTAGLLAAGHALGQAAVSCNVVLYTPNQWKGEIPKPIHHVRIWGRLSPLERRLLGGLATERAIEAAVEKGARNRWGKRGVKYYPDSFVTHNLLDAVGLNLFHTGRMTR